MGRIHCVACFFACTWQTKYIIFAHLCDVDSAEKARDGNDPHLRRQSMVCPQHVDIKPAICYILALRLRRSTQAPFFRKGRLAAPRPEAWVSPRGALPPDAGKI